MVKKTLSEWLQWQEALHPVEIDLGLSRLQLVADRMGFKGFSCPAITVTGTNGKGSCCAFLEAILLEAGLRTGVYTSPHLFTYNERFRIAGDTVSDEALCHAFEFIESVRQDTSLSFFEYGTLAAFQLFQQAALDVVILEVGLGGRLDAVNLVDADVAVITSVDLDHALFLGNTRESVGYEKAGIFRAKGKAVCGDCSPPRSVMDEATRLGINLYSMGRDFGYIHRNTYWTFTAGTHVLDNLPLPRLLLQNAATALMAIECLPTLGIKRHAIERGLQTANLPGRFQQLSEQPRVIVDVAHNPHAARMLARQLKAQGDYFTIAIVGMMADKDIRMTLAPLVEVVDEWHVCDLPVARAARGSVIADHLTILGVNNITVYLHLEDAYHYVLANAEAKARVVIFGSFFVAGPVLKMHFKS